jgi:hypothetical protein
MVQGEDEQVESPLLISPYYKIKYFVGSSPRVGKREYTDLRRKEKLLNSHKEDSLN